MRNLVLRWQSIIAALMGFVLSVAWEVGAITPVSSSIVQYPFTWFFGAVAVGLLVWGVVDTLREQRQTSRVPSEAAGNTTGDAADRLEQLERRVSKLDDQVQELRREEL